MRLKAPKHIGHPVIGGVEVKPRDDGCYHVDNPAHIEHMLATGFYDVDAPKQEAQAAKRGRAKHR